MSSSVRDLARFPASNLHVDTATPGVVRPRSDAQMGIQELAVLRFDVDMVAPAEAASLAEPSVALYSGQLTTGDHLRLPQRTRLDGPSIRAAVFRLLGVDLAAPGGTPAARSAEAKMMRTLASLDDAVAEIQAQAQLETRA